MADLSIIVLSKTPAYVARLSEALQPQLDALEMDVEKFLVNNANDMNLTAAALKAGWMVVEPGYNTSFSIGNNMAANAATGLDLLLLNDDLVPSENFLNEMILTEDRAQSEVVGALLLNGDGTVNHAGTMVAPDGRTDHIGRGQAAAGWGGCCSEFCCVVPAATFAAVRIRRDLWKQLGGLDQAYYYGWEDTDFCIRAMQARARLQVNHLAVATHDECGTRPRGGAHDQSNYTLFVQRWTAALPGILQDYERRHEGSGQLIGIY